MSFIKNSIFGTFRDPWIRTRITEKLPFLLTAVLNLFLTFGSGTSSALNENLRPLSNTNIPLISGKNGLRNHFWPLESCFLMNKSENKSIFSKLPYFPILISWDLIVCTFLCTKVKNLLKIIFFLLMHADDQCVVKVGRVISFRLSQDRPWHNIWVGNSALSCPILIINIKKMTDKTKITTMVNMTATTATTATTNVANTTTMTTMTMATMRKLYQQLT